MNELPINYNNFISWLEAYSDNFIVGVTHTSTHNVICTYLKETNNIKAIYVFLYTTKLCKNGLWNEYINPEWVTKLLKEADQLHEVKQCNKYCLAVLGKKLTKVDVLKCVIKLSNKPKKTKLKVVSNLQPEGVA